jgi:hypothetical protein
VPGLDALIEGSWIAVIDAALTAVGRGAPLGPIPFAVAAGASLYVTRQSVDRTTQLVGLGVLYVGTFVAGGLIGGVLAAGTGPISPGNVAPQGFAQVSAILMVLAVFRGSRHSDALDDDLVNGSLLTWGFPLLALPWLFGAQLQPVERDVFVATAFPSTLTFAASGLLAVGLARLEALSVLSGVDWRSNRAWFVLLLGVLAVMLVIAVPAALVLGSPLVAIAAGLLGPLSVVLAPVGAVFEKLIELIFFLLSPVIDFITGLVRQRPQQQPPATISPGSLLPPDLQENEPSLVGTIVAIVIVALVVIAVFVLILRVTARARPPAADRPDAPLVEREFRPPRLRLRTPRFRRPTGRPHATTAAGAYVAFLADLETVPHLARQPEEPPATHARRLRSAGFEDPRAAFLAADYELEQYALRKLPARETRRALLRGAGLREVLRTLPRRRVPAAGGDAAASD